MSNESSTSAQRFAWCLYDFGNSAFPTVIITAVYALYFSSVVVGDDPPGHADRLWGNATSLGALLVFLAGPVLGVVADRFQAKRLLMWAHAWLCVGATVLMAWTGPGTVVFATVLVVLGLYGFEGANVFYNAYLPELAPRERAARLSGRAWAFGYVGGLLCLVLVLGLREAGVEIRWMPLAVAAWFLVFTAPALVVLRDSGRDDRAAAPDDGVLARLRLIAAHQPMHRFLLALFFYMNALNTVYVFAALFAQKSLGFTTGESIVLIMVLNVVAAPGALLFARLAEVVGSRRSIGVSLWLWLVVVVGSVVAAWPGLLGSEATRKTFFWCVAGLASLCIGATQATSRTFVAEIAPAGMAGQYFGFMALAGRASAVVGPFVFGVVSQAAGGDQRFAVGSIGLFFAVGIVLLRRVPSPGSSR